MQLKALAKTQDALNSIKNIGVATEELSIIGQKYSLETLKSAIAQSTLNKSQIEAILIANGLQDELIETTADELANAASTNAVSASQAGTTATTLGLGTAFKGLGIKISKATASMKAFLLTNPLGWLTAIVTAIGTVVASIVIAHKKHIEAIEECKERVDELMSSYQSAIDKANDNAKTVENLSSKYEKLSEGVNNLGENVSLTSDEYSEYNDVVNQIADMFPTLVQGYTDEGNAILSLKGNVDQLTTAYQEAQQAAYNLLTDNESADDIIKNWENNNFGAFSNINRRDALNNLLNMSYDEFRLSDTLGSDIHELLNISTYDYFTITEEEFRNIRNNAKTLVQTYQAEIDSALKGVQTLANTYLMTNEDYSQLDEATKNATSIIVNSINENIANGFDDANDVGAYVTNIVSTIKDNPEVQDALVGLFSLDTSEMNLEDAKAQIDQYINYIASVLDKDAFELKVQLRFDDIDQTVSNYQNLLHDAAKKASGATIQEIRNQTGNYEKYQEIYDAIDEFANEYSINTQDEIAYFQDALEEADYDINKAFKLYLDKMQDAVNGDDFTPTISSSVQQIATQLEPQFAKLGDAYASIFSDDGFNLDVVDNPMLEELRKSFAEIGEDVGVDFDADKINEFFDALENGTKDSTDAAEVAQQAFNDLATAYFYSTDTLEHLNEETAESIKQQLQQMGVVNNEEVVDHYLALSNAESDLIAMHEQLAEAQRALAESSNTGEYKSAKGRIDLAYKQIEAYYNEKGATEELRIALFNLQLQQANLDINSINTSSSVTQLLRLAESAGLTAEYMDKLVYLQQLFNQYQSATEGNMRSAIYSQIQSVKYQIANDLEAPQLELEFDFPNGKDSGAGSAGKDAADEYMDGFNAEFDRLKFLRDNGIITEKEYLDQSRILYEKYFKDREEYLKEYVEHEREYLNGLKDLYENVMGGITDLLDDQIDKIEEERDAKIDALEEEQEARTKALEQQKEQLDLQIEEIESQIKGKNAAIDAINDEIDAIKEANDEKQRQIDLQKAQYDLERMQNQRTILQYSEEKGMHYVNDTSGIRDAKQAVDDAKTEIEIADKEKQISLIEDEISLLEARKTLIGDQQEDLDKQIDALDEYYKKLIENTEAYYSTLIKPIEDYKAQFANIADIEKSATFIEQLESLGYSVDDILSLNASSLENFKSNYLGILRDMYDDNTQMVDAIKQVSGLEGEFVGYLSQSQPYIDSLARLDLSSTQTAIDSANSGIHSFADGAELATVNMTTMADTTTALLSGDKKHVGIISRFEEMASVLADANNHIVGIGSAVEELDGKTATVTINIETNGDTSLLSMAHADGTVSKSFDASYNAQYGKAFADGTGEYKGLPKAEKNALVSEYGQEEMTILPNGKTIITDQPTMMDLPKGTVIFNEEQTKKIIDNKVDLSRNAHADGTDDSIWTTLSDGTKVRPLQPGDKMYDLVQKFDAYFKSIDGNLDKLVPNSFYEYNRQMNDIVNQITNSSIVNNNINVQPVISVGDIHVTCPGVTSQEVMREVGDALGKQIGHLAQRAIQEQPRRY